MAGGALFGAGAVTGLTAAGDVAGSAGTGNMFDTARPVDNARVGQFTPGAATLNLRGLGVNRNTHADRRPPRQSRATLRAPSTSTRFRRSPSAASRSSPAVPRRCTAPTRSPASPISSCATISTACQVRARGGINEAGGDGEEWQFSTLMGINVGDRGHAMVAMDYSKRQIALWKNRSFFREAMESPLSNSGDYIFGWYPGYAPGAYCTAGCPVRCTCTTTSLAATAGGGSNNVFNNAWAGNGPTQAAINAVFGDRTCGAASTASPMPSGGYLFNPDGTLFTRSSATPRWAA